MQIFNEDLQYCSSSRVNWTQGMQRLPSKQLSESTTASKLEENMERRVCVLNSEAEKEPNSGLAYRK